jgi:5-methylcytosine-specific restriction endonuclease McrA
MDDMRFFLNIILICRVRPPSHMPKPLLDRKQYDHPEHFDDEIREYRTSKRYVPTPLENLLYELAAHRCTICLAPWLEIHHIDELSEGGSTQYENLIVLCPNCHTRVHSECVPSKAELRHYKFKQEIAYELPVISRLTADERDFVNELGSKSPEDQLVFSRKVTDTIAAPNQDLAIETLRKRVGYFHLQESSIIDINLELVATNAEDKTVLVSLRIRATGKGLKWLRYLREANRIPLP